MAGGIGMPLNFYALKFIPMTKANLIFNINPLVIAITGYLILNEKITKINVLALIGAFAGMILFNIHKNETKNVSDLYYIGIAMVT